MTRQRDFQRSKVYRAERLAFGVRFDAATQVPGSYACELPNDGIHRSKGRAGSYVGTESDDGATVLWQRYEWEMLPWALSLAECKDLADRIGERYHLGPIRVKDGRGRRKAAAWYYQRTIALPRWARTRHIVCHEMAHMIGKDSHGPAFARAYVELIARYCGKDDARLLRSAFRTCKVQVASDRKDG